MTDRAALVEAAGDENLLFLDPPETFDKCIVGVVQRFGSVFVLYSKKAIIEALVEDSDEDDEDPHLSAVEHFDYNVAGGWVGDQTPAFLIDDAD